MRCKICGEKSYASVTDVIKNDWICNKCRYSSNHSNAGTNPNKEVQINYFQGDVTINPVVKKVSQIKTFKNTTIEEINKWLLDNKIKEVLSFKDEPYKIFEQWVGGGRSESGHVSTIIYTIEVRD